MSIGLDTWILIVLTALSVFAAFYFPIRTMRSTQTLQNNEQKSQPSLLLKKKTFFWVISFITILLLGDWGWHLYRDKEPIVVFAGGGSVRNYLKQNYSLDVREQHHSINIALASGSSWRVLSEEYQLRKKDRKMNKFITICLSAGEISEKFYSEYLSNMENTIVAAVYLGDDNLVTYISKDMLANWKMLHSDTISSKVLANKIQDLIVSNQQVRINKEFKKVRIFSTNKTSGTLETYKKKLSKYIDLDKMIDSTIVSIFYDDMEPENINKYSVNNTSYNREFIILGSQYYMVSELSEDLYEPLEVVDSIGESIPKPMYMYFLAKKVNPNQYEINKSVLRFLKKIDESGSLPKSKQSNWDKIMKSGIIEYNMSNSPYINIKQIN